MCKVILDLFETKFSTKDELPVELFMIKKGEHSGYIFIGDWALNYKIDLGHNMVHGYHQISTGVTGKIDFLKGKISFSYGRMQIFNEAYIKFICRDKEDRLTFNLVVKYADFGGTAHIMQMKEDKTQVVLNLKTGELSGKNMSVQLKPKVKVMRKMLMKAGVV